MGCPSQTIPNALAEVPRLGLGQSNANGLSRITSDPEGEPLQPKRLERVGSPRVGLAEGGKGIVTVSFVPQRHQLFGKPLVCSFLEASSVGEDQGHLLPAELILREVALPHCLGMFRHLPIVGEGGMLEGGED